MPAGLIEAISSRGSVAAAGLAESMIDCPTTMWSGFVMWLAWARAATVVWLRAAMFPKVSPGRTV
jgi:hypothetical protein